MKFCKDCAHARVGGGRVAVFAAWVFREDVFDGAKCAKTEVSGSVDLVTGSRSLPVMRNCSGARIDICGPDAVLFEERAAPTPAVKPRR